MNSSYKNKKSDPALKRWCFFIIFWFVFCFFLAGVTLYQSIDGMEERFVGDAAFLVIPLIFFTIGMLMYRRLLKERSFATDLTTATVISKGRNIHTGRRCFFPEYEFQVGEETYQVKSPSGYSVCFVEEGKSVDLYYDPENPAMFYVPIMQKHDKRWAMLLCVVGIVYPLIGFFAPQIRQLVSFLE